MLLNVDEVLWKMVASFGVRMQKGFTDEGKLLYFDPSHYLQVNR